MFLGIMSEFHPGCRTTFADCEANVRRYASEHRRQDHQALETRLRKDVAEKGARPVTESWRKAFRPCGSPVPVTGGEAADCVVTVLRG